MLPTGPLISCEQSDAQPRWEVVVALLAERCPVHTSIFGAASTQRASQPNNPQSAAASPHRRRRTSGAAAVCRLCLATIMITVLMIGCTPIDACRG
jgi:hypothetical protein